MDGGGVAARILVADTEVYVCVSEDDNGRLFSPRTPRKRTGEERGPQRAESGAQQEAPGPGTRWVWPLPVSVPGV